ncbi:MAG: AbrB/MazE/SpoVT family DNA-binding domain-containing protein [Candidatus Acidiferrum sp.]
MATKITVGKKDRIVLPKSLLEKLDVKPGDTLLAESEYDCITLRPARQKALLKKELGIWVYQGEPSSASIPDLNDAEHKKRLWELSGSGAYGRRRL